MFVAFHMRGYVFPLKARLGDILGCDPPDKGFHSVGNPPEEFSSDLKSGARISEVDSGVLKGAVRGVRTPLSKPGESPDSEIARLTPTGFRSSTKMYTHGQMAGTRQLLVANPQTAPLVMHLT